ncbi:MAG: PAS domain S-box protein [Magnetococcales bacterium]|nr:PAS domain S-box protein [Magnetococcales bacterium]
MGKKPTRPNTLRTIAEAQLAHQPPTGMAVPLATDQLAHELHVHQIELEMQNEELRRAQTELAISRDRYRDLYDFAPAGYLTLTDAGLITEANLTGAALLGMARDRLHRCGFIRFIHPDNIARWQRFFATLLRDGQQSSELLLQRGDQSPFQAHLDGLYQATRDNLPAMVCLILTDISARQQAEETLRLSDEALRLRETILLNVDEGIVLTRADDGTIVYTNPKFERLFGYAPDQLHGKHISLLNAPTDKTPAETAAIIQTDLQQTGRWAGEICNQRQDGTIFWCYATVSTFAHREFGTVWVSIHRDISEQKRVEQKLAESTQLLLETERMGKVGGWELQTNTGKLTWTEEIYRIHEVDPAFEPTVAQAIQFYPPPARARIAEAVQRAIEQGEPYDLELELITAKGSLRHVHTIGKADAAHHRIYGFFQDITERKQLELALRDNEHTILRQKDIQMALAKLSKDFLASQGGSMEEIAHCVLATSLTVTDSQGGFVDEIDPHTGLSTHRIQVGEIGPHSPDRDAASGCEVADGCMTADRLLSVPVSSGGRTVARIAVTNRVRAYTPDDRVILEGIADLFAIVLERVKLERQLRHARRLEAVGTLAGGIAHDFNNILAIILGNVELVTFGVSALDEVSKNISDAANRGRDLVRQLLTFSRQTGSERQCLNPVPLVKEVLQLMRSTVPASIEIRAEIQDREVHILADPTLLYQIIMNLCTNASQAIGERGGSITVGVEQILLEEEQARLLQIKPGQYLLLSVQDTGPGIAAEVLERIFEPFFTTKRIGQGTGLGLAVVHGAVHRCGGKIQVESNPGAGTLFRVYLPALDTPGKGERRP